MAKKTIQNKWAQNSSNVQTFTEEEVAAGIEYKGAVVSNQLNGVAADLYEFADNLQRAGTAWNPLKSYEIGDVVEVRAVLNGEQSIAKFACIEAGKSAPLVDNGATSFILDDSKNVCVFTITDDGTKTLKAYCGSAWITLKEPVFVEAKKEVLLEVKDHVISTAFVGLNYEVDLEAIVEANSNYKKGQFKIKSCQFIPNLTAGSAVNNCTYVYTYVRGVLNSSANLEFNKNAIKTFYNLFTQSVAQNSSSATATAAYVATATATASAGNKSAIAKIKIVYEVWNSDKTIIIDRLTTGAMLFINENQKLLIQNEEANCQSRTMGGTFYFKLEV